MQFWEIAQNIGMPPSFGVCAPLWEIMDPPLPMDKDFLKYF